MERMERRAALTGAGQSEVGRRLGRDPLELTLDACLAAIEDAGLTTRDIDGLSTYPGSGGPFGGASGAELHDALRAAHEVKGFALLQCTLAPDDLSPISRRYIRASAKKARAKPGA